VLITRWILEQLEKAAHKRAKGIMYDKILLISTSLLHIAGYYRAKLHIFFVITALKRELFLQK
jgi:hypothetical protein